MSPDPIALRTALLLLLGCGLVSAAPAQVRIEAIPDSVLRPYTVPDEPSLPGASLGGRTSPSFNTSDAPRIWRDYSVLGGAVQLEAPKQAADGSYSRPKVIVGLPSDSMKSWMNSAGFTTERCLLPMVRARARINNEGEASGALWLYARCTFQ